MQTRDDERAHGSAAPAPALCPALPSPDFVARIPHEFARRHLVMSVGTVDGIEQLRAAPSTPPVAIHNVGVALGRACEAVPDAPEAIALSIDRAYAAAHTPSPDHGEHEQSQIVVSTSDDLELDLAAAVREAESDLLSTQGKAPTVRLVDLVIFEAVHRGASDVHIQPVRDRTLVRYRLDGALHTVRELPGSLAASVVSRVKVMARLNVAERHAPQDGRATVSIGRSVGGSARGPSSAGRRIDLRVSTLPSASGERVVLRLLDPARSPHQLSFAALGMPPDIQSRFLAQAARTSGIVLSTGPTGSGKTTTLYAALTWISTTNAGGLARGCELNIMTIEDPVEYDLSGPGLAISQAPVDSRKGMSFAAGLRHILRQDPDVIMVGEIRDDETARIAVQASLTGHLVLSTLHTVDAASAVARLVDLGVEPFLVASSLSAVLAQRLVRTIHGACGGVGCEHCLRSGFSGRTGVFELLVMDAAIRELVMKRSPAEEIKAAARRAGMTTLLDAGEKLVRENRTTRQELARAVDSPHDPHGNQQEQSTEVGSA